ncbi:uncharacterized protein LOC126836134 [Adelges cooleyi]|uniref:uncharacterized protein LOC126836134 n=1 Tax=Adelges cooleyi TaxID=133065 RepID=UPI002180246D|nr:uncharacterized protein LOC126836134 [Adelges cooleyi]XP_050425227.1 uncharacterized protein LOC126836134 [Adelges cooleyi]XP_050425228.1 uncharacterized protein LOC126836134 [Adelges cooleyi]
MGLIEWINNIFNKNYSNGIPSEFQLPTGNINELQHPTNNFNGNSMEHNNDITIDESINIFNQTIHEILQNLQFEFGQDFFSDNFVTSEESNFFPNILMNDELLNPTSNENQPSKQDVPKSNHIAQKYFLIPSSTSSINEGVDLENRVTNSNTLSKYIQSSSLVRNSQQYKGRWIQQDIHTKQLPNGQVEKTIIQKDGNQSCNTIITEDPVTGHRHIKKQLVNLDDSQLNEFEKRFSKFQMG